MKKLFSLLLALTMVLILFAGCANGDADTTTEPSSDATTESTTESTTEGTTESTTESTGESNEFVEPELSQLAAIIEKIYEENPVEFAPMTLDLDLSDPDGLAYYTGLTDASQLTAAAVSEAMIGSIPYSLVLVQVADAANAQTVAEDMKNGIDQRKWICVEADDLQVSGCGDVVMLIMIGSEYGSAQTFTDAFKAACGTDLDFTI